MGIKAFNHSNFKTARDYFELALKEAKESENKAFEETVYENLGRAYGSLGECRKAIEFFKLSLTIVTETGDKRSEGTVYNDLGQAYNSLGEPRKAIEFFQLSLTIATGTGDKSLKGTVYNNLGKAYDSLGEPRKAIEFYQLSLTIATETGNQSLERIVYNDLGSAYNSLGEYRKAVEFFKLSLTIVTETGNKNWKGTVYTNLGSAYSSLGESRKAIEFYQLSLTIATETGNKMLEGYIYNNLGGAYDCLGEFRKAIEFYQLSLTIATKTGNKSLEGYIYNNLGGAYNALRESRKAIEFCQLSLTIATKTGNKSLEGYIYNNLGGAYDALGESRKAIEFCQLSLTIATETGNKGLEGSVYGTLGGVYESFGDFRKTTELYQQSLNIATETGNKNSEGTVYNYLGCVYKSLGDVRKAIEFYQLSLNIATETGDKSALQAVYNNLGSAYKSLGDVRKAIEFCQLSLALAKETENKFGEARAYDNLAGCFCALKDFLEAEESCKSSVRLLEETRALLQGKDEWKINFRDKHDFTYTHLRRLQLRQGKILKTLATAEAGRAQALMDLMKSRYDVSTSIWSSSEQDRELIMSNSSLSSSPILFLAEEERHEDFKTSLSFWLILNGQQCQMVQKEINGKLTSLIYKTYENIGVRTGVGCKPLISQQDDESAALKTLYDLVIAPFSDLINGDELIIIPDRASFLIPYAALMDQQSRYLSETLRIRLAPSLTSLQLLAECPEGHHSTSGALLVGNPWVETVRIKDNKPFPQLPGAEKEAKMIGQILNTEPLIGKKATKDQVLSRLNSVSLVHLAAHGCRETGEIILSPNVADADRPKEEDFLLTKADVLGVQLRARLVLLSCCYSGRGEIKAEGVVGIARAFLGAGARSVIASLWALSDEATLEFMKHFYEHLVEGKSASKSLHQAMKWMRESDEFNAVQYWAPFVLIGDDVTLNFEPIKGENHIKV